MAILKAQKGIPTRNVDPYPEEKIREDRTDAKLKEWDTIQNSPGGWWKGRSIPTTKDPALRRELARRQAGYDVKPVKEKAKDLAVNAAWSFIPELPIVKNAIGTAAGKVAERFITKNPLKDDIASGLLRKSPKFKSEINWGTWNKEIPDNKTLLDEYNAIERTAKAKGTWMKNPDGSVFEGTPEQFIQQNSSNFKKAFPEGHNKVYRGIMEDTGDIADNKAMFTADESLAHDYAGTDKSKIGPNDINKKSGVYELAHKKSPNSFEFDAGNDYFSNVHMDPRPAATREYIQNEIDILTRQKAGYADRLKKYVRTESGNWKIPGEEFEMPNSIYNDGVSGFDRNLERLSRRMKDLDQSTRNPKLLEKFRQDLGPISNTDDIAKHVEKTGTDYVKLKNIVDFGAGDVTIVNHKPGNYLKSLYGNNGMFDMTNPNIYKAVAPLAVVGAGTGLLKRK